MSSLNTIQGNVKRQWELEGLHCANCALKIEDKVGKIEGVSSCSVNFVTKTLTMVTDEDHADLVSGGRSAKSSLLKLLDAQIEGAQDILQLLKFILNKTHGCDWR